LNLEPLTPKPKPLNSKSQTLTRKGSPQTPDPRP